MAVNEDQGNAIVPGSEDNSLLQAINDSGGSGAVPDLNLPTNFEPDAPNPPPPPEIPQNNPPPGGDDSTTHEPDDATNSNVGNVPIIKFDPNFGTPQPNNPIPSPPPPLSPPFIPTGPFDWGQTPRNEPTPPPADGSTIDDLVPPPGPGSPMSPQERDDLLNAAPGQISPAEVKAREEASKKHLQDLLQ